MAASTVSERNRARTWVIVPGQPAVTLNSRARTGMQHGSPMGMTADLRPAVRLVVSVDQLAHKRGHGVGVERFTPPGGEDQAAICRSRPIQRPAVLPPDDGGVP